MTLRFVICGLEHSGTTLLSDIFRQVPTLDAGFEVGVLLSDSPRNFSAVQPFYRNMMDGWQITEEHLKVICETDNFDRFYKGLKDKSAVLDSVVVEIFDKTPRYFQEIFSCYEKAQTPFLATYKDPRSIVFSDFKRTGKGKDFSLWYDEYKKPKLNYLRRIYMNSYLPWKYGNEKFGAKILCISLEKICLDTRNTMETIFSHVGLEFKLDYLLLKNLRYSHTRAPEISSRIPFEYLEFLNKDQTTKIEDDFCEFEDWFYS